MTPAKIEKWVWVLIYGGLLTLSLGYFMHAQTVWLGELLMAAGGVAAAAGVVLIWVRSRMKR
jgi:hypothetical protein